MNKTIPPAGAEFSQCGTYRYKLWRIWDDSKPKAMCIGLNPSTANYKKNDNTINILIRVLTKLGYGGFYMMNLFAIVSSKPEVLLTCSDPLGDNDSKLDEVAAHCDDVIVCWGAFKQAQERIREVLPRFPNALCFGINANGTPWHPRFISYAGQLSNPSLKKYLHHE
jgi:hypothetical protein